MVEAIARYGDQGRECGASRSAMTVATGGLSRSRRTSPSTGYGKDRENPCGTAPASPTFEAEAGSSRYRLPDRRSSARDPRKFRLDGGSPP